MANTKVLHVIARMNIGGTAKYIEELVRSIPGSALATGMVQGSEREDSLVNLLSVYRVTHLGRRVSLLNDFRAWLELRRIVKDLQPEVVHTHTFKAGLIGRLINGNHKRVHTFHGHLFGDETFSFFQKFMIAKVERFLAMRTDLLISVGVRVGKELRTLGIGEDKDWLSIPPGVSQLVKNEKGLSRNKLGLPEDRFLVGWMARVTGVKNPDLLVEVARLMPDVHFAVAGGGDLLEHIRQAKPPNMTVLGWTESSIFWSAVDCALSTSLNEGMPIALIEAQLAGLPVVATNVGSNSEVIINKKTGFVTRSNPEDMATALRRLMDNVDLRTSMGQQATLRSLEKFSVQELVKSHLAAYETLH